MSPALAAVDRLLARFSRWQILAIGSCGVGVVGVFDYATGYEVSISVFYLVPVAPQLTCSIGVVTFTNAIPAMEEAMRAVDKLMYQAKREGKNKIAFGAAAKEGAR